MAENRVTPVDVDRLLEEVRAELSAREVPQQAVRFEDVSGEHLRQYYAKTRQYVPGAMEKLADRTAGEAAVDWVQPADAGAQPGPLKRLIRRMTRFMVIPMNEGQNRFNEDAAETMKQAVKYFHEQDRRIRELERQVHDLREELKERDEASGRGGAGR